MKKKLALVLIMVLVFSNSMVAYGTLTSEKKSESSNVTATYNRMSGTATYSVYICWGFFDFTYTTYGSWDTANHNYGTEGSWNHTTKEAANTITVINNSDAEVDTFFSIAEHDLLPNGVTLNIREDENTIIANATKSGTGTLDSGKTLATAANPAATADQLKREAYVTLNGAPTTVFNDGTKIASVTVTIDTDANSPG